MSQEYDQSDFMEMNKLLSALGIAITEYRTLEHK